VSIPEIPLFDGTEESFTARDDAIMAWWRDMLLGELHRLRPAQRRRARWVASEQTRVMLMTMRDPDGGYLFFTLPLSTNDPETLFGLPIDVAPNLNGLHIEITVLNEW